jgi:hypothetical protein
MADTKPKADEKPAEPVNPLAGLRSGRVVDYVMPDGVTHVPATVTWVSDTLGKVDLYVYPSRLTEGYILYPADVPFDPNGKIPGSWHWLERVD